MNINYDKMCTTAELEEKVATDEDGKNKVQFQKLKLSIFKSLLEAGGKQESCMCSQNDHET